MSVEQAALDRASTLRETAARPSQSRATPDTERVRAAACRMEMLAAGGQRHRRLLHVAGERAARAASRHAGSGGRAARAGGFVWARGVRFGRGCGHLHRGMSMCVAMGCSCVAARLAGVRGGLRRRRQRRQCTRRTRVRDWRRTVASDQFAASRTRWEPCPTRVLAKRAFGANPGHRAAAGGRARANRNKKQNSTVRRPLRALGVGRSRGPIPCSGRKRSSRTWPAIFTRALLQSRSSGDGNLLV